MLRPRRLHLTALPGSSFNACPFKDALSSARTLVTPFSSLV
jgi:hypothetical protein